MQQQAQDTAQQQQQQPQQQQPNANKEIVRNGEKRDLVGPLVRSAEVGIQRPEKISRQLANFGIIFSVASHFVCAN